MLTRKDFMAIAEILRFRVNLMPLSTYGILINDFAEWLKTTNPKFSESRFKDKCSGKDEKE